jgi:putative hydrolases of HD superfamily
MDDRFEKLIAFLKEIEKFKHVERDILYADGLRKENDAEHVWHMMMFLWMFKNEMPKELDFEKMTKLILVHDLPEIYSGDVSAFSTSSREGKKERELVASKQLFSKLPEDLSKEFMDLFEEYVKGETPEAKYVKSIDKLQPQIQNICSDGASLKFRGISEVKVNSYVLPYVEHDKFMKDLYFRLTKEISDKKLFF